MVLLFLIRTHMSFPIGIRLSMELYLNLPMHRMLQLGATFPLMEACKLLKNLYISPLDTASISIFSSQPQLWQEHRHQGAASRWEPGTTRLARLALTVEKQSCPCRVPL